jgi:hypothetical protein
MVTGGGAVSLGRRQLRTFRVIECGLADWSAGNQADP